MNVISQEARDIADRVGQFVLNVVAPYESDPRCGNHGPSDALGEELRAKATEAGLLVPHIREDGSHFSHAETALILRKSGLSPLGPIACHVMAPDEAPLIGSIVVVLLVSAVIVEAIMISVSEQREQCTKSSH